MRNRRIFSILSAVTMIGMLSACAAKVPLAPQDMDLKAKNMSAPPDKALVYLYRNESFGGAVKMNVKLDGRAVGQTAPRTYFMWLLNPGKHEIVSEAENTSTLSLDARAGKTYYIWQEVKMGILSARSKLQLVEREKGREGVNESSLVQEQR